MSAIGGLSRHLFWSWETSQGALLVLQRCCSSVNWAPVVVGNHEWATRRSEVPPPPRGGTLGSKYVR